VRQFECQFAPASAGPKPLVLLLDTGIRQITFVNLPGRPIRPLQSDRFSYAFPYPLGGGDGHAEIGRYDSSLRVTRVAGKTRPVVSMQGDCKSVAVGARL
jgi:hypothetical protein